jgi:signal recognition particle subunit SEC65
LYSTCEEVKRAVQRLKIKTSTEYQKRYKKDPRLPSKPARFKGWISWPNFFGKPTPDFYPTYKEAKRAVQRLNIKASAEYFKRYKEDPRLPSTPNAFYKDKGWIDWFNFFGKPTPDFYPTYKEAKRAVQRLNIKTSTEYPKRYKKDPRLPSNPDKFYKNKGWIEFLDFFRKEKK